MYAALDNEEKCETKKCERKVSLNEENPMSLAKRIWAVKKTKRLDSSSWLMSSFEPEVYPVV